jgi:hypothetical protein
MVGVHHAEHARTQGREPGAEVGLRQLAAASVEDRIPHSVIGIVRYWQLSARGRGVDGRGLATSTSR